MSEPIQLISVDGELHLMPKEDGGEPIILLYRYGEGDVDCIKTGRPNMEHLTAALFDEREMGNIPSDVAIAKLPNGNLVNF